MRRKTSFLLWNWNGINFVYIFFVIFFFCLLSFLTKSSAYTHHTEGDRQMRKWHQLSVNKIDQTKLTYGKMQYTAKKRRKKKRSVKVKLVDEKRCVTVHEAHSRATHSKFSMLTLSLTQSFFLSLSLASKSETKVFPRI